MRRDHSAFSTAAKRGASALGLMGLLLLGQQGCVEIYSSRPVSAQIVDGDSGAPLQDATLEVKYDTFPIFPAWNKPRDLCLRSDCSGRVEFRVLSDNPTWVLSKPGYEPQEHYAGSDLVPQLFLEDSVGVLKIPIYRPPAPEIVIVVPVGFRGAVGVGLESLPSGTPADPGLRSLRVELPASGIVQGPYPGPFNLTSRHAIRMQYTDGTSIEQASRDSAPDDVAQRWVLGFDDGVLFVIGTEADREHLLRRLIECPHEHRLASAHACCSEP